MKKSLSLLLLMILLLFSVGCNESDSDKTDIIVFAASSLTETLSQAEQLYEKNNTNVDLIFNFDSSGTLKTQIEEGATCDVFISANKNSIDKLEKVDLIHRENLLENKVALAVTDDVVVRIKSFDDMSQALKNGTIFMAIGNEDVPVGNYTKKIFEYFDIDESELNKNKVLTYCSNAKEVTTMLSEEIIDCAIVYTTDAKTSNLNIVDIATEEMCGKVIYPLAILGTSDNINISSDFISFLRTDEMKTVFENAGFTIIEN